MFCIFILTRNVKASLLESSLLSHKYSFQSRGNLLRKELTKYPYLLFAREWLYIWTTTHLLQWQQIPFKRWICYLFLGGVFGNLVRISFNLVLPRNLFLSETLEKITFNPGLSGKLLLILENELGTSPPSSSPELQRQGTRCWWSHPDILSCKRQVFRNKKNYRGGWIKNSIIVSVSNLNNCGKVIYWSSSHPPSPKVKT